MDSDKRQVMFVTRALWGGGAEKVVYDLAHGMTRQVFRPAVAYLFNQGEGLVSYDPSIPVFSLEPAVETPCETARSCRAIGVGQALSNRLGMGSRYSALATRLGRFCRIPFRIHWLSLRLLARTLFRKPKFDSMAAAIASAQPHAFALGRILGSSPHDVLIVSIMEEASVRVWLSQRLQKRPYIVSLHSYESVNLPLMYPEPCRLGAEKTLFIEACRAAKAVVVPSHACRQDMIEHFSIPSDRVKVIPNPLDIEAIRAKAAEPLPDTFNAMKKTVFLSVGRLSPDKNHKLLLEAASLLKKRYDDFLVLLIGEGNMEESLRTQVEAYDLSEHVLLLGHIPNPYPFMRKAKALIVTSLVESFSLVLVEAMACGTVPISVDCPGGPREVLDDGQYGMLIPPDDPEALSNAMWDASHNDGLCDSYRRVGTRRAEEYDISRITFEWEGLFREV